MLIPTVSPEPIAEASEPVTRVRGVQTNAQFLARTSLLLCGLSSLALVASLLSFHAANLKDWLVMLLLVLVNGVCIGAWFSARKSWLLLAAWLLVVSLVVANTFLFVSGSDASFLSTLSVFMLAAILAMLTLGTRIAYGVVLWGNLATIFLWLTNGIFIVKNGGAVAYKIGLDDLTILITVQLLTIWLVNYLIRRLLKANQTTQAQATQLSATLSDLERKRQLGEETSQKLLALSVQLHATANQQASGSNQQAAALAQVIAFIQELTQTSHLIAGEANQLKEATQTISHSTEQAKAVSYKVRQISENSAAAVKQTTEQNEQVNNLYLALGKVLTELSQSQDEIRKVVGLIRDLGNQTHLLALNAALEAVGAGEYGERFGVVAQEVKALADHSIVASHQANQMLGFVENRIEQASQVADRGYAQTQAALSLAHHSTTIMGQLIAIIESNVEEIEQIERAASLINTQANEISHITHQQYSASIEGVEKLQLIGAIATQTASSSQQVTSSTHNVEELAQHLLVALR